VEGAVGRGHLSFTLQQSGFILRATLIQPLLSGVPIPGAVWMLGGALAGLGVLRYGQRKPGGGSR
jgi:hypothetical protein